MWRAKIGTTKSIIEFYLIEAPQTSVIDNLKDIAYDEILKMKNLYVHPQKQFRLLFFNDYAALNSL